MNHEEDKAAEELLNPEASVAQQRSTLKFFAEYLEQGYILNLPAPKSMARALETFSQRSDIDSKLKTRANNLIKKYCK